jgi:hypothetical protein
MTTWQCRFAAGTCGAIVLAATLTWIFRSSRRELFPARQPRVPETYSAIAVGGGHDSPAQTDSVEWIGSRKCAECHSDLWKSYESTPMAHSAAPVLLAAIVEDYTLHTSFANPESRIYRVERSADHVFHHESMTDADGAVIFDQAVEVHYAIGSGKRGRSYLIDRGGIMKVSPITWYSQAGRWDLSPGYQPRLHKRFDRRAVDLCLVCHVGRLSFDRDKPDRYGNPPLLEAAIGCERCHGPGAGHIRFHQGADPNSDQIDPIVNPARLDPARREDVCNQCHLLGDRILRHGRTAHDFRPGERLEETWAIFLKGNGIENDQTTRAVGQVDQMRESACFEKSAGRLGCVSCHDPHSSPAAADREAFYNGRCANCHSDGGCSLPPAERSAAPAAGSCIACHMRPLSTNNVPHTSQTDHRILRRPDAARTSRPTGEMELFDHAEQRLPPLDLVRALAIMQARSVLRHPDAASIARLEAQLRDVTDRYPDDVDVLMVLGILSMLERRPSDAREFWETVLRLRSEHEGALLQLAQFEKEAGHTAEAIELLERYRAIDPRQAELQGYLGELQWNAGCREEGIASATEGLNLDPRLAPLRRWLAGALRQLGRLEEAEEHEHVLQRMRGR